MNSQERQLLQEFLNQLTAVREVAKDSEAAALIQDAFAKQPDAAYLAVQRAILLEQGLARANAKIAELESRAQQGAGGFLDSSPWREGHGYRGAQPLGGRSFGGSSSSSSFGGGSFLGTAAATAAGVAAGAFLLNGLQHLFGGHEISDLAAPTDFHPGEVLASNRIYDDRSAPSASNESPDDDEFDADFGADNGFDEFDTDGSWA